MTVKTFIQGLVTDVLSDSVSGDHYGAQILDVVFYSDEYETEVAPSGGSYLTQWSSNGTSFISFEGANFPVDVSAPVEDWQAGGYVDAIRAIPISITGATHWRVYYRAHRFGMPNIPARALASNDYFSAVSTVQVSGFEFSVLQGNALSTSQELIIPAGSVVSIRVAKNVNGVFTFAAAKGVFVALNNGDVSGNLIALNSGYRLNYLEESQLQASFEYYDGPATGARVVADWENVGPPFITNGNGVIELINNSDSEVTTFFSTGISALSAPIPQTILTPDTQLETNTEMGDFNG